MTCFGTAKVGFIYAKATPSNAGKFMVRCSDPKGKCYGQIPVEIAQSRVECSCGWPFYICQRFITITPPEGSQMEVDDVNLRIKKGYGVTKVANQSKIRMAKTFLTNTCGAAHTPRTEVNSVTHLSKARMKDLHINTGLNKRRF